MPVIANTDRNWDDKYARRDTPWDSRLPSAELVRVLSEFDLPRGRVLELGCGSGTNALFLAEQGFEVTAVDCAEAPLVEARERAAAAGVEVDWIAADVQGFGAGLLPFDFLFDRGCYHCCRRVDLDGYLRTHRNATASGTWCLVLTGNPNDGVEGGPPKLTAVELATEFDPLYRIIQLREFHFQDAGGVRGPLGWSCLMRRR